MLTVVVVVVPIRSSIDSSVDSSIGGIDSTDGSIDGIDSRVCSGNVDGIASMNSFRYSCWAPGLNEFPASVVSWTS